MKARGDSFVDLGFQDLIDIRNGVIPIVDNMILAHHRRLMDISIGQGDDPERIKEHKQTMTLLKKLFDEGVVERVGWHILDDNKEWE